VGDALAAAATITGGRNLAKVLDALASHLSVMEPESLHAVWGRCLRQAAADGASAVAQTITALRPALHRLMQKDSETP
jgi:hypothetical protein